VRQEWSTHRKQAIGCPPVICMSIPPWRRVEDACLGNRSIGIGCALSYQSSAYAYYGVFRPPFSS